MTDQQPWAVEVFRGKRGKYPLMEWVRAQKEYHAKAKILRKLERLARATRYSPPERIGRPMVDTLDGSIKELRVDEEVRVLFVWRYDIRTILVLDATRKKGNRRVSKTVIARAKRNLREWEATRASDPARDIME